MATDDCAVSAEGEDTIRPSSLHKMLVSSRGDEVSAQTRGIELHKPLPGTPSSVDGLLQELALLAEGPVTDQLWRVRGSSTESTQSSESAGEDVFQASEGSKGGQMGDVKPGLSIQSSPETPLARKNSQKSIKRSLEAAKASQMLSAALNGDSPPPTVVKRSSSLRRKASVSSQTSLRPIPERSASFSQLHGASLELESLMMKRSTSEPFAAGSVPLSYTPSTDSETFTSTSGSTRTSAGMYTGRMSTASSSFTLDTDLSSPYTSEDKASVESLDATADLNSVGLGISADYAVNLAETTSQPMGKSRSLSQSSGRERIWSPSHSRFGSQSSSNSAVFQDKVVRCLPGADVTDLMVPLDTTQLLLAGAAKGLDALLERVLPTISTTLLTLDLSRTSLRSLPSAIVACKRLQELSISGNRLEGANIPPVLAEITSLRKLILDGCRLNHLTTSLAPLTELRVLSLRYNALRSLPSWLPQLPALETLLVDGNPFVPHWQGLVRPLLDLKLPVNAATLHALSLSTSQGSSSQESLNTTLREGAISPARSARKVSKGRDNSRPPAVLRPPPGLRKMKSLGDATGLYSATTSAPISSTVDLPVRPASPLLVFPTPANDTIPPSLPFDILRSPPTSGSGSVRKKGFLQAIRMPSHQGRSKGDSSEEQSPPPESSSKSSRFLTSGFRRTRTSSGLSAKSAASATPPAVTRQLPSTSDDSSDAQSVATSLSTRPSTSLSMRPSRDRREAALSRASSTEEDDESEVLAGAVAMSPSTVDAPAGLRMLMAYLRDLEDLSAQDLALSTRSRPSSAKSRQSLSRSTDQLTPRSPSTPPLLSPSASNSPVLNVHGYPSPEIIESPRTPDRPRKYVDVDTIKLKNDPSKRERVIAEIISTEQSYVKGLEDLVEIYVRPAAEQSGDGPVVPVTERRAVFSNVEDILRFHASVFLPDLEVAMLPLRSARDSLATPADLPLDNALVSMAAERVADVFRKHAAFLKMYAVYITGFDQALTRFQNWSSSESSSSKGSSSTSSKLVMAAGVASMAAPGSVSPDTIGNNGALLSSSQRKKLKSYLKHCRAHPKHTQLNCESYLLLPVQRIPRYKMLLESLLSCTPIEEGSDGTLSPNPNLVDALELASALANDMNERKRESEGRKRLLAWQNRIGATRFRSPLVQPHRVLIREGPLVLSRVVKRSTAFAEGRPRTAKDSPTDLRPNLLQVPSLQIKTESKPLIALLCSDILVLVHDSGATAGSVELFTVFRPSASRTEPASSFGGDGMLRVVDSRAILYLKCATNEDAEMWAHAINEKMSHH